MVAGRCAQSSACSCGVREHLASRRPCEATAAGRSSGGDACLCCCVGSSHTPQCWGSHRHSSWAHPACRAWPRTGLPLRAPRRHAGGGMQAQKAKTLTLRLVVVEVGTASMLRRTATGALGALRRLGHDSRLLSTSTSGGYKLIDHEFDAIVVGAGEGAAPQAACPGSPRGAPTPSAERPPSPARPPARRWRRSARGSGPERGGLQHSVSGGRRGAACRLPGPLRHHGASCWLTL